MSIRRRSLVLVLGAALTASPAFAAEHLLKVNEVMVASATGDTTVQFVELETPGESYPNGAYTLQYFSASGTVIGTQALSSLDSTVRYYVAVTDNARTALSLGNVGREGNVVKVNLAFDLEASGTACFRQSARLLHCMSWGNPSSIPAGAEFGYVAGVAPPNGQSVQRLASNMCAVPGAPTPTMANTATGACPTPGTDAGVPDAPAGDGGSNPDGGGGNNNGDDDDGCSVGSGAGWFTLVAAVSVIAIARSSRRRREDVA